mmetsp:Transcript_51116/g.108605  ORF Transcript_51116/g.108605 Transcript_51116/m.108605 type:complete len:381 (-) Transcript_51116:206-1348(-)
MKSVGDLLRPLQIGAPDTRSKSVLAIVGPLDNLVDRRIGHDRQHWTELLLVNDTSALSNASQDGWGEKVAVALQWSSTSQDLGSILFGVLHQAFHLVKLHPIVDGSELYALGEAVTNLGVLRQLCQVASHLVEDVFVHVGSLDGNANLTGVAHGELEQPFCGGFRIGIVQDDGSVVATQLQGQALQSGARGALNGLAGPSGTSEGNLVHALMCNKPLTELIATGQDVQDACWENVAKNFSKQQSAQGSVGRRFDDAHVASRQCLCELPPGHERRKVPRSDTTNDTDRHSPLDDSLLLVIHENFFVLEVRTREMFQCSDDAHELTFRHGDRLALLLHQNLCERIQILLDLGCCLRQESLSFFDWCGSPGWKSFSSSSHSLI